MAPFQKRHLAVAVASALWLALSASVLPASAQTDDTEAKLDALFAELSEPGRGDWMRIEREISRLWSRSGSDAMDLLLHRGHEAMAVEDYAGAVEHFSALIDHAPDFAEGWNARATAFYHMGEYELSIADIERVLALNPRHFGALSGFAMMLEDLGETDTAIKVLRAAHDIHPNRPDIIEALARLERQTGGTDL